MAGHGKRLLLNFVVVVVLVVVVVIVVIVLVLDWKCNTKLGVGVRHTNICQDKPHSNFIKRRVSNWTVQLIFISYETILHDHSCFWWCCYRCNSSSSFWSSTLVLWMLALHLTHCCVSSRKVGG